MRVRVWLRSAPGMWAQYDGHVDVTVRTFDNAFREAVRKLARTSFPDRPALDSWRFVRLELLGEPGQRALL